MKDSKQTGKPKGLKPFTKAILINIGVAAVATAIIIWMALVWLDVWTDHGDYVVVPQVKGMSFESASEILRSEDFVIEVSDSMYEENSRPGTVLEQNPKEGAKVKVGRTVYLTITAYMPKAVSVPAIVDVSERQARSALEGIGIKDVRTVRVPSEFRDLVVGVKYDDKPLAPGTRIPVTATVVLEVGQGLGEDADTLAVDSDVVFDEGMEPSFFE